MERLRYVARAEGVSQSALVTEAADALVDVVADPAGLVTACRQMVQRQPTSGALVSMAARLLSADDPRTAVWDIVEDVRDDPTARELGHALPDDAVVVVHGWPEIVTAALGRRGDLEVRIIDGPVSARGLPDLEVEPLEVGLDAASGVTAAATVVLIEASAVGSTGALVARGGAVVATVAARHGVPVWVVGGRGRPLPEPLFRAVLERCGCSDRPWTASTELLEAELVARAVGIGGPMTLDELARLDSCPPAPELQ